jgi:hypothetical protein
VVAGAGVVGVGRCTNDDAAPGPVLPPPAEVPPPDELPPAALPGFTPPVGESVPTAPTSPEATWVIAPGASRLPGCRSGGVGGGRVGRQTREGRLDGAGGRGGGDPRRGVAWSSPAPVESALGRCLPVSAAGNRAGHEGDGDQHVERGAEHRPAERPRGCADNRTITSRIRTRAPALAGAEPAVGATARWRPLVRGSSTPGSCTANSLGRRHLGFKR